MSKHTVADAKSNLSKLIDRDLEGKPVIITRHGRPIVELRALLVPANSITTKPITPESVDWVVKRRVSKSSRLNAGQLVSATRDAE
jgi:antitoxin (DNA-binding transcriptional repressor) of toxin-antitoxin stability system